MQWVVICYLSGPNEPVGKVLLTIENGVFGAQLTLPKHEIVDWGAFYEITVFRISPKNLLGDFFYSFNVGVDRGRAEQGIFFIYLLL
jgi:hypothetical protein